ncbi:hypothetical protein [Streptomyces aidingensis]|uniref:GLTT repeat-containing protein n=1 Tax=Streptomyces aidingensis TaxID=910347 RepID=A0A1I1EI69_9ACTN|nr:hypothetical protein [Streptomyces aidingensis]SFB86737.1 hypothetical protein SAMN05421773_101315 [Streptomyces aidingensis]
MKQATVKSLGAAAVGAAFAVTAAGSAAALGGDYVDGAVDATVRSLPGKLGAILPDGARTLAAGQGLLGTTVQEVTTTPLLQRTPLNTPLSEVVGNDILQDGSIGGVPTEGSPLQMLGGLPLAELPVGPHLVESVSL